MILHKKWACHHSSKNKGRSKTGVSKKCTDCQATINIRIKLVTRDTLKKDHFLRLDPPLCAVIDARILHNHSVNLYESLRRLPLCDNVRTDFIQYFCDGMSPCEAMRAHENNLLLRDDSEHLLASGAQNPTPGLVYRLNREWKLSNLGFVLPSMDRLKEKASSYQSIGISVRIQDESPWAVLICTDIMKRVQNLQSAGEIVYIDSTLGSDSSRPYITQILTTTKAGALPLAIVVHEESTREGYKAAFDILEQNFPWCFGGKIAPDIFITDDSHALKDALHDVYPSSRQLISHFHMAHNEWRTLMAPSSGINKQRRHQLMYNFKSVMYADTHEALAEAISQIDLIDVDDNFWQRLQKNLERQKEWVELYRVDEIAKTDDANNYTAATIRIMKEIMLNGTKNFNVVALVEYCSIFWDQYCKYTLLEFAHNLHPQPLRLYDRLCRNIADANPELTLLANQIDADTYEIPSVSTLDKVYTIDVCVGMCNCPNGSQGAFCKHQAWLHKYFDTPFPSFPDLTATERQFLAQLALGEHCPDESSFEDDHLKDLSEIIDQKINPENFVKLEVDAKPNIDEILQPDNDFFSPVDAETDIEEECKSAINRVGHSLQQFSELVANDPSPMNVKALLKLEKKLCKVTTCSQATEILLDVTAAISAKVRTGGSKKGGAHSTSSLVRNKEDSAPEPKRRCLAENVEQNIESVKKTHGLCSEYKVSSSGDCCPSVTTVYDSALCSFIL